LILAVTRRRLRVLAGLQFPSRAAIRQVRAVAPVPSTGRHVHQPDSEKIMHRPWLESLGRIQSKLALVIMVAAGPVLMTATVAVAQGLEVEACFARVGGGGQHTARRQGSRRDRALRRRQRGHSRRLGTGDTLRQRPNSGAMGVRSFFRAVF
jgi:hypothetical protein